MEQLLTVFALALAFYILIPGIGAFAVRYRWRTFRRKTSAASLFAIAGYRQMRRAAAAESGEYLGKFRFTGNLEAIQGDDILWLNDGSVSFSVDMKGQGVAILAGLDSGGSTADQSPQLVPWRKLSHLTEGVRMFIGGGFYVDHGRGVFRGEKGNPLTAIMYGGPDKTMLPRAIYSGRQRNEYWNQLTPASLGAGALALLTAAYVNLRIPGFRLEGLLSVTLSLAPFSPLFPPGIVLFFFYRRFWSRGRALRAERDMVQLPLRHFIDGLADSTAVRIPSGERYAAAAMPRELVHHLTERGATTLVPTQSAGGASYYVFGAVEPSGRLGPPQDPHAEFTVVAGDPRTRAHGCQKAARRLETLAVALAAGAILVNLYVVLVLLSSLVR